MFELDIKYGYRFDGLTIDFADQKAILENIMKTGRPHPLLHKEGEPEVLRLLNFHTWDINDPENIENMFGREFYLRNKDKMNSYDIDDIYFINRLNKK